MTIRFLVDQNGPTIGTRIKGEIPKPELPREIENILVKRGIAERVDKAKKETKEKGVNDDN